MTNQPANTNRIPLVRAKECGILVDVILNNNVIIIHVITRKNLDVT